jgi:hypothetical protein
LQPVKALEQRYPMPSIGQLETHANNLKTIFKPLIFRCSGKITLFFRGRGI